MDVERYSGKIFSFSLRLIIMSDIESNCSDNISNRDELTATDQRKNDGATEQQIDNVTEHRNFGKRPFDEAQKPVPSFKRQRWEALADEEQHEWELPDELASYANKYLQKFVKEKSLEDSILNEKPSVDLFGRVFRDHVKETAKVKEECKEIYRRERPDQNKRPFNNGPSFLK